MLLREIMAGCGDHMKYIIAKIKVLKHVKKVKLSLEQTVEAHRDVRRRGSHSF
jgi:hypothetical protein